jgi:hypothetical protein
LKIMNLIEQQNNYIPFKWLKPMIYNLIWHFMIWLWFVIPINSLLVYSQYFSKI